MNVRARSHMHPRLHGAATFPIGRILLGLMVAEWLVVLLLTVAGRITGDVAWFLAFFAVTSTLFFLSAYDTVIEAVLLHTQAAEEEAPERFSVPPRVATLPVLRWLRRRENNLAWILFGAGIVAGHLWWH